MQKLIAFIFFIAFSLNGLSQNKAYNKVSIDEFITETQFGSDNADVVDIIWWIPTEYWNVIFAQDKTSTIEELNGIVDMVKEYVVVISVKGKVGTFGGVTFDSEEKVKAATSVTFKGEDLIMVAEDEISQDMKNFISMIKPMMKNMMGPMGENMQMILFKDPENKAILPIDPISKDKIVFKLAEFEKEVALPLGSLLEDKVCPEDKAELSGKWAFCPYHGTKLVTKK